jgi:mono/diheme cytochrome c family protein
MKIRHALFLTAILFLLTACNFSLAQDVTPPPDYVPPTPQPTMGPLYPASTPDVTKGAAIFAEKCAPCHGDAGMGDGPQGKQLPVTVAALAVPATAQKAIPSTWYTTVTQGNLERFMPPFASLSDQERWDVVVYALTLHTTPQQIEQGKSLFESSCTDCAKYFNNQKMMSALSEDDIIQTIKQGAGDIPAFGSKFTDDEARAVAAYIRTLTFGAPTVASTTTESAGTPSAETESTPGTPQAEVTPEAAGIGNVSGSIDNKSGADLPSDLKVTLHGYEHSGDMSTGPKEVATLEGTVNPDGTFEFQNVESPDKRIFVAEVTIDGAVYKSGFVVADANKKDLVIPPIVLYTNTTDFSTLKIDSLQIFFDFATEGKVQIFSVYTITNATDKNVVVKMAGATDVPFIAFPDGAEALGFEATQDSAPFTQTGDGFAMPPSTTPYGLIAYASMEKANKVSITQSARLPIEKVSIVLPEGMTAKGDLLTDQGIQAQQNANYHIYSASGLKKDDQLKFTVSGNLPSTAVNADLLQNKTLLIGIGIFGLVLILAGVWMFMRDRRKSGEEDDEDEDDEFEDPESLMDAIIALDDLHRAGKIPDESYQQRRNELKEALKRKAN